MFQVEHTPIPPTPTVTRPYPRKGVPVYRASITKMKYNLKKILIYFFMGILKKKFLKIFYVYFEKKISENFLW